MTLLLVWNFIKQFWMPIVVTAMLGLVTAWHFNAIHKAVKANNLEWQAKNKANLDAWIAKVREADDITHAKEVEFNTTVTTINANHDKETNDAKIILAAALARPRLRDPFNPTQRSNTCQTETRPITEAHNGTTGAELSTQASDFLRTEAARADEVVRESNAIKAILIETYRVCSN